MDTTKNEKLDCNSGDLAEAHGELFQALGELAATLDAVVDYGVDDVVRDRVVAAIGHIGAARNGLIAAVRQIEPEVEGRYHAAAASVGGGAA